MSSPVLHLYNLKMYSTRVETKYSEKNHFYFGMFNRRELLCICTRGKLCKSEFYFSYMYFILKMKTSIYKAEKTH